MPDDLIDGELEKQEAQERRTMRKLFWEAAPIAVATCLLAPLAALLLGNWYVIFWILVPRIALATMVVSYGPAWLWLFLGHRFGWSPGMTRFGAVVFATATVCILSFVLPRYVRFK